MTRQARVHVLVSLVLMLSVVAILLVTTGVRAQQQRPSSFSPVIEEPIDVVRARDKANKARVMAESQRRLEPITSCTIQASSGFIKRAWKAE
jgi:hypothetical protein